MSRSKDISSISDAIAVTPNDGTNLGLGTTRAIYVGVTGNLSVVMASGNTVTFANLPVGWHPIQAQRVRSTGTTASSIIAGY